MQMRVKMQQPAYKCEKMQMRAVFVNGPIPVINHSRQSRLSAKCCNNFCDQFYTYFEQQN